MSASVQIGAHGAVSGDTITIEVVRWYLGGNSSQEFTVILERPAVLATLCAVSGNAAEP